MYNNMDKNMNKKMPHMKSAHRELPSVDTKGHQEIEIVIELICWIKKHTIMVFTSCRRTTVNFLFMHSG